MKTHSKLLLAGAIAGVLLANPASADSWEVPHDGFLIQLSTPNGIAQKSGQTAQINGTITWVGGHLPPGQKGWGDHGHDSDDLTDLLKNDGLQIHAYFPDATTDVTSQLQLTPSRNGITVQFTTPALQSQVPSALTLIVTHEDPMVFALQKVEAKLNVRIAALQAAIAKVTAQGDSAQDIAWLQSQVAELQAVSARINAKILAGNEVLAQQVFPLQVDNIVATGSMNSSLIEPFRFTVSYDIGSAIEGESTIAHGIIARDSDDGDPNGQGSGYWIPRFFWNGNQVQQLTAQKITPGSQVEFDYHVSSLDPSEQNNFSESLTRSDHDNGGHWHWDDWWNQPGFWNNQSGGMLAYQLPVAVDNVPPTWVASSTPSQNVCMNAMQPINMTAFDTFGLVDPDSVQATLTGTLTNGTAVNQDITQQITATTPDQGQTYDFTGNLNPIPDGLYNFSIASTDLAGNATTPNPYTAQFRVDSVPPTVTLGPLAQIYTNAPYTNIANLAFSAATVDYFDLCSITTTATDGSTVLGSSTTGTLNVSTRLQDGVHEIAVSAVNSSTGLASSTQSFPLILDTVPPVLSNMVPAINATILATLNVNVSGQANEPLLYAKVNGQSLTLSADQKSFSGVVTAVSQGPLTLHYEVADLATNVTKLDVPVQIVFSALNKNLISIQPDSNGKSLDIVGAVGAAIPGETIDISTGLLSSYTVTANSDGSFEMTVAPFSQVSISANDAAYNLTSSDTLNYGPAGGTKLSGVVEDTAGLPLAGVTVSIANSNIPSVQTDATGTFLFSEPVTGDQTLIVNGGTAQTQPGATPRTFYSIRYPVSIGLVQSNVLPRPIYLQGVPNDGSVPLVDASAGGVVTSPDAPGVTLDIPAGAAQFPGGLSAPVYMAQISAKYSTVKPFDFAKPQNVIALEPSGTTFSQPVQLTLPNDNNLPAGVQVAIMSMDSRNGFWSIDGVGVVSSDGSSIVTKPGQGITHFSMVYATPVGPTVRQIGAQDQPGADTFNGALTTAIRMPTYKLLGSDAGPELLYRSSWARPSTLVSNLFDLSSMEIDLTSSSSGSRSLSVQSCFGPFCSSQDITAYWQSSQTGLAWYQPRLITAQFFTDSIASPVMNFAGAPLLPERSVVSFGTDLLDPTSGNYLASGVYPYISHYQLYLNQLVVGTRKVTVWTDVDPTPQVSVYSLNNEMQIDQAFPQDLGGPIFVQNEINSAAGRGWRIAGVQKIANPSGSRVMVEEPDGSMSSFAVGNSMTTLFNDTNNPGSLTHGAGFSWPSAYVTDSSGHGIRQVNLVTGSDSNAGSTPTLTGTVFEFKTGIVEANQWGCETTNQATSQPGIASQLVPLPNGNVLAADSTLSAVFQLSGGTPSIISGSYAPIPTGAEYDFAGSLPMWGNSLWVNPLSNTPGAFNTIYPIQCSTLPSTQHCDTTGQYWYSINDFTGGFCGTPGIECAPIQRNNFYYAPTTCDNLGEHCTTSQHPACGASSGQMASPGWNGDGPLPRQMNNPLGIAAGPTPNTIVVADTGNNRVRLIDLNAHTMTTIAGNGQTYDNGDGGPATQASMFHPRGVAYDALGNLYISTENGFVRKVDPTGVISTFVGSTSGVLADSVGATNALLNKPYGMVVDNDNGYLYVADTGDHRIIRIDFQTQTATAVAGNGGPGDSIDGQAALMGGLSSPTFVGLDSSNNLLIVDSGNNKIKRVTFQAGSGGAASYQLSSSPNPGVRQNPDGSWVMALTKNSDGTWTRNYRNGDVAYFDAAGNETLYQDRVGRKTEYTYDGNENLIQIIDPTGRSTQYNYAGSNLTSITGPAGRTTQFIYGANNTLTKVMFPDGTSRSYTYSADGLMTSETNQNGSTNYYSYNAYHRLASVQTDQQPAVTVNDSASQTAINNYTGDQVAPAVAYGTNPDEVNDSVSDPMQNKTTFAKDYRGYVETIVNAAGAKTEIERDNFGDPLSITRPDGTQETMTYDPLYTDLLSQTDSGTGVTTSQTYDSYGNILTKTTGRGGTATKQYDPNTGLLLVSLDPLGHGLRYTYNSLGLPISVTNSLGLGVTTAYDSRGNPLSITDSANHTTSYTYDAAGNVLSMTDANGHTTSYAYDYFDRLVSVTTPKGESTQYTYFPNGELSQVKDAKGNITSYAYNSLGQMTQKTDPLGFVTVDKYDADGNLIQETDPNGNVKKYVYNNLNQLMQKQLPDNTVNMTYDVRGGVTQAENLQSVVNFSYDDDERLISVQSEGLGTASSVPSVRLTFSYDADDNRSSMSDPVGTTTYSYDLADKLLSLTNPKGETFALGWDSGNRLTQITRPGSSTAIAFDNANFITSIIHSSGGTPMVSLSYTHDNIGGITGIQTGTGVNRTLAYDADEQISTATNPEAPQAVMRNESYNYDSISNRTQDEGGSYTYSSHSQRLVRDYRYTYVYDNNGNLSSRIEVGSGVGTDGFLGETTNYFYSSENQLIGIKVYPQGSSTPSKVITYSYDALGRRIQKVVVDNTAPIDPVKTFTQSYVYDGQNIVLEYDGDGNLLARYTNSGINAGAPIAVDVTDNGVTARLAQSAQSYIYLKDQLGTVTDITDTSGNHLQHYIYSVFGQILGIQNAMAQDITANPALNTSYMFTGQQYDSESGNYYLRARYYDPNSGRFFQQDPSPGSLSVPSSVTNKYVYAANSPELFTDPSGASIWGDIKGAIAGDLLGSFIAGPVGGLIGAIATVSMLERGVISEADVDKILVVEAIVLASAATGGAAGAAAGTGLGGTVAGAAAGGLTGGAIGGLEHNTLGFSGFSQGFWFGFGIGAAVGGTVGGIEGQAVQVANENAADANAASSISDTGEHGTDGQWVKVPDNSQYYDPTEPGYHYEWQPTPGIIHTTWGVIKI